LDDLGNKCRNKYNGPITITGTGVLVCADIIKELGGWPFRTLTEDMELSVNCIIRGYSTLYYEHAIVYTEEPLKLKAANKRRERWLRGFAQCDKLYRKEIKKLTFGECISWKYLEKLYGLVPLITFAAASVVMSVLGFTWWIVFGLFGAGSPWLILSKYALLPFAMMYVLLFLFTLLILIVAGRDMKVRLYEKFIVLLLNPVYQLQYFFVYVKAYISRKEFCWSAVERAVYEPGGLQTCLIEEKDEELAERVN